MVTPRNESSCINVLGAYELENIRSLDWNNLRAGGAGPCAADLHGLASHDRALVSAEISKLDCPHHAGVVTVFTGIAARIDGVNTKSALFKAPPSIRWEGEC